MAEFEFEIFEDVGAHERPVLLHQPRSPSTSCSQSTRQHPHRATPTTFHVSPRKDNDASAPSLATSFRWSRSGIGIAPPHRLNENHFQATLPSLADAAELLLLMP